MFCDALFNKVDDVEHLAVFSEYVDVFLAKGARLDTLDNNNTTPWDRLRTIIDTMFCNGDCGDLYGPLLALRAKTEAAFLKQNLYEQLQQLDSSPSFLKKM